MISAAKIRRWVWKGAVVVEDPGNSGKGIFGEVKSFEVLRKVIEYQVVFENSDYLAGLIIHNV